MAATIEVKYFNSFLLKNQERATVTGFLGGKLWNGSFGIPQAIGGYNQQITEDAKTWYIEESRIRAGYNNTSTDYGARAYIVEDEPRSSIKFNGLIYSGIFNSRTATNQTNVFSVADEITKSVDPANGSIQLLYAEDTNLVVFQEGKVSRALIDKDAIYSAEGGGAVTNSNLVIGTIQPYGGEHGIGTHPESFAIYGFHKYFVDPIHNVVMRLGGNGSLIQISDAGMKAFFRDTISSVDSPVFGKGKMIGGWDIYSKEYVLSLQPSDPNITYKTLTFDEKVKGWVSFYTYEPSQVFSVANNYYTAKDSKLYKQHEQSVDYNLFYGVAYNSSISFVFNPQVSNEKVFSTISYEGTSGWEVNSIVSDATGFIPGYTGPFPGEPGFAFDTSNLIYSYVKGAYDNFGNEYPAALTPPINRAGFDRKENKYVANIVNSSQAFEGEVIFGDKMSGLKGFYTNVTISTDNVTNPGGYKEIFAVSSNYTFSNGY
tara:strand:- start:1223 stop:2680 length:1458 start_codon:yes stop_codon:yes gene_type:complete